MWGFLTEKNLKLETNYFSVEEKPGYNLFLVLPKKLKKKKKKTKSEKNFKKKEKKKGRKKRKVKERDYFSNCFTCYLLCCSVAQFISYLLPPSGLYFLWWILQKQLLKFFLNQHRKKINTSFLVEV